MESDLNRSRKDIIIVCEDTYGLDLFMMIEAINARASQINAQQYEVLGFISSSEQPFGEIVPPKPLLGRIEQWTEFDRAVYAMGIRDPGRKEEAVRFLKEKGARFETLIAPWTLLPFHFEVGEGSIIGNYSCKNNSRFGDFVILDTVMCETVEVGDYSTLCPFVNMTSAKIGNRVFIGSHSVIMSRKTVGDGAYIYPGSVVVKNVKPGSVLAGVPASKLTKDK